MEVIRMETVLETAKDTSSIKVFISLRILFQFMTVIKTKYRNNLNAESDIIMPISQIIKDFRWFGDGIQWQSTYFSFMSPGLHPWHEKTKILTPIKLYLLF